MKIVKKVNYEVTMVNGKKYNIPKKRFLNAIKALGNMDNYLVEDATINETSADNTYKTTTAEIQPSKGFALYKACPAFVDFLVEKDALDKYLYYIVANESVIVKPEEVTPDELISGTLSWKDTKEGPMYWLNLNYDWQNYLQAR